MMTFDLDQPMFYDLCLGDVGLAQSVATSHHPERMGLASPLTCDAVFCAITAAWNVRPRMRGELLAALGTSLGVEPRWA